MIRLNGENLSGYEQKSIQELITALGYEQTRIAVEKNGEIIPKTKYATSILSDNDVLEIVTFVGGG